MQIGHKRFDFFQKSGFSPAVCNTAGSIAGTSDDEAGPNGLTYIHTKVGRSPKWTSLVRQGDEERARLLEFEGKRAAARAIRSCIVPPTPIDGVLMKLPKDITLDWFELKIFASLPFQKRAEYKPVIALSENEATYLSIHRTNGRP
jgi:hypothetical protein